MRNIKFDNNILNDILIFILPPLGVFYTIKNNTIPISKKTLLISIALINLLCIIAFCISL